MSIKERVIYLSHRRKPVSRFWNSLDFGFRRNDATRIIQSFLKAILIFGVLSLVCIQPSFAGSNFLVRLATYDKDTAICRAFVDARTCVEVANLIKNRSNFEKVTNDTVAREEEGEPITRKYLERGKLRIIEMGYPAELSDSVRHYYLISQGRLFVVDILTPHPQQIEEEIQAIGSGAKLSPEDRTPISYGFLFDKNMKLEKEYSWHGKSHPKIPQSEVDGVLSAYREFGRP